MSVHCDLRSLAVPGVRSLEPYQPGKPLEVLEREYGVRDAIKLASNENPLGPGRQALEALRRAVPHVGRYPDGSGLVLKKALAQHLGVATEQLTLGNGSNDVLELVARTFAGSAHEVIFAQHAFAVYPLITQAIGATAVVVPARDYGHDLEAMRTAITAHTRLVFIANPNNPTGTWLNAQALRRFCEAVPPQVLVVVDEAYFEYVEAPGYAGCVHWIERFPNLIVTRTFSKVHGLAGLRIGYGISHATVADLLNRVRQPFNVNSLALTAAEAALHDHGHVALSLAVNRAGLEQLAVACRRLGLAYIPSVGNFLCIDLARPAHAIYEALLRQGVIVRPVANYALPNHLRITVGTEAENLRCIEALERVLG